jgi:hypothetical protein
VGSVPPPLPPELFVNPSAEALTAAEKGEAIKKVTCR